MAEKTARPREATWSGVLIIIGSVVIVISAFERIASLTTLDARREIEEMLAEPPGSGLGISVDTMLEIIRVTSMVAGGIAAATAILGYQVLQRSRSGRRTLAFLAPPLFVSGLVAGGFMASLVAASTVWLYLQPNRDWFNGKEPTRREPVEPGRRMWSGTTKTNAPSKPDDTPQSGGTSPAGEPEREPVGTPAPDAQENDRAPRPVVGFGDSATGSTTTLTGPRTQTDDSSSPPERPGVVTAAALITWIFSGLTILVLAATALFVVLAPERLFEALEEQDPDFAGGQSREAIADGSVFTCVVLIIWAVAAIVAAVLAFKRNRIGWIALSISSGAGSLMLGIGALFFVVLLIPFAASAAAFSLLLRPAAVAWFRAGENR